MILPSLTDPDSVLVSEVHSSPNFEIRKNGMGPEILVMHYTGMASARKAIEWLSDPESKVSAHYVIDEEGIITQLVSEDMRAWHAGQSFWAGETDINSASIGIEIQNPGHDDGYENYSDSQMESVLKLSHDIISRHNIQSTRVLAHSDIAPERKIDPGEKFNWQWLYENRVGHWVPPEPISDKDQGYEFGHMCSEIAATQEELARYGYGIEATGRADDKTMKVVRAFQLHFRPGRVDGRIDESTQMTLKRLTDAQSEVLTS